MLTVRYLAPLDLKALAVGYGPHRAIYLTRIDAKCEGFRAQAVQG